MPIKDGQLRKRYDKKRGKIRRAKDAIPCPECGKPMCASARWCRSCWFKKCVEEHRFPQGSKHHWYKNGRPKTSEGYIRIKQPNHPFADHNGYVAEHRYIMEQHLGRILDRKEFVHHLNGIKDDNRPENLAAVSRSEHNHRHGERRIRELEAEVARLRELLNGHLD